MSTKDCHWPIVPPRGQYGEQQNPQNSTFSFYSTRSWDQRFPRDTRPDSLKSSGSEPYPQLLTAVIENILVNKCTRLKKYIIFLTVLLLGFHFEFVLKTQKTKGIEYRLNAKKILEFKSSCPIINKNYENETI